MTPPDNRPSTTTSNSRVVSMSTSTSIIGDSMEKGQETQNVRTTEAAQDNGMRKKRLGFLLISLVLAIGFVFGGTSSVLRGAPFNRRYSRNLKTEDFARMDPISIQLCQDNEGCGVDSYCKRGEGKCTTQGVCAEVPQICTAIYDPVCGCDGETYASECMAAGAGVSVLAQGECVIECDTDEDCPEENAFCKSPPGKCGTGKGECTDTPQGCPIDYSLVCGCDGNTYVNACTADAAGVSILAVGACCEIDDDCEAEEFCKHARGVCEGPGSCTTKPQACTDVFNPVCGCNGGTFSNACMARAAGVSIASNGECPGCDSNADCDEDSYCAFVSGACEGPGECAVTPEACPDVYDPVCDCEENTYGNACEAAAAGVSVASAGECEVGDP